MSSKVTEKWPVRYKNHKSLRLLLRLRLPAIHQEKGIPHVFNFNIFQWLVSLGNYEIWVLNSKRKSIYLSFYFNKSMKNFCGLYEFVTESQIQDSTQKFKSVYDLIALDKLRYFLRTTNVYEKYVLIAENFRKMKYLFCYIASQTTCSLMRLMLKNIRPNSSKMCQKIIAEQLCAYAIQLSKKYTVLLNVTQYMIWW